MPFGFSIYAWTLLLWQQETELQLSIADTDGMIERYVPLEGSEEPRMLSYAEVHALRHDLEAC